MGYRLWSGVRDLDELLEGVGRAAVVDGGGGGGEPVGEAVDLARGDQTGRGVEHDDVAMGAGLTGEHRSGRGDVRVDVAAAPRRGVDRRQPVGRRVELVAPQIAVVAQLDHRGRGGRGELVEAVV